MVIRRGAAQGARRAAADRCGRAGPWRGEHGLHTAATAATPGGARRVLSAPQAPCTSHATRTDLACEAMDHPRACHCRVGASSALWRRVQSAPAASAAAWARRVLLCVWTSAPPDVCLAPLPRRGRRGRARCTPRGAVAAPRRASKLSAGATRLSCAARARAPCAQGTHRNASHTTLYRVVSQWAACPASSPRPTRPWAAKHIHRRSVPPPGVLIRQSSAPGCV